MKNRFKELMKENNLSEWIIFDRQISSTRTIHEFHFLCIYLYMSYAKKFPFDTFKKENTLKKGQSWNKEYTKMLKQKIEEDYV